MSIKNGQLNQPNQIIATDSNGRMVTTTEISATTFYSGSTDLYDIFSKPGDATDGQATTVSGNSVNLGGDFDDNILLSNSNNNELEINMSTVDLTGAESYTKFSKNKLDFKTVHKENSSKYGDLYVSSSIFRTQVRQGDSALIKSSIYMDANNVTIGMYGAIFDELNFLGFTNTYTQFDTTLHSNGLTYFNADSYSNVTWATDDLAIPSIGMIKDNIYTGITAENGLTNNAGTIQLGGALTENTTIVATGNEFKIKTLSGFGNEEHSIVNDDTKVSLEYNDTSDPKLKTSLKVEKDLVSVFSYSDFSNTYVSGLSARANKVELLSKSLVGLNVLKSEIGSGISISTEDGLGANYNNRSIDESGVTWSTDNNHIPSIGMIKDNVVPTVLVNGNATTANGNAVDLGGNANADIDISLGDKDFKISGTDDFLGNEVHEFSKVAGVLQMSYSDTDTVAQSLIKIANSNAISILSYSDKNNAYGSGISVSTIKTDITVNDATGLNRISVDVGLGVKIITEDGKGLSFNDYTVDEANVDWATDDDNIPSIGMIKDNIYTGITAENGLTETNGNITLGGSLTATTSILGGGEDKDFVIGGQSLADRFANINTYTTLGETIYGADGFAGSARAYGDPGQWGAIATNGTVVESSVNIAVGTTQLHSTNGTENTTIQTDVIQASFQTSDGVGGASELSLDINGEWSISTNQSESASIVSNTIGTIFTDQHTVKKGIEYADNYSASFVDNSLVTKKFVKDTLQAIKFVTNTISLIDSDEGIILVNHSGPITITLPQTPVQGTKFIIKDESGNALSNNIIVDAGSSTVEKNVSDLLNESFASVTYVFNGNNNYFII